MQKPPSKQGAAAGETQALADLNTIRERAGLTAVNLSGQALLEEILLQRRLELASRRASLFRPEKKWHGYHQGNR